MKKVTEFYTIEELNEFTKAELKELMSDHEIEFDASGNKEALLKAAAEHFVQSDGEPEEDDKPDGKQTEEQANSLLDALAPKKEEVDEKADDSKETPLGRMLSGPELTKRLNEQRLRKAAKARNQE